jgi:hypothetical protein
MFGHPLLSLSSVGDGRVRKPPVQGDRGVTEVRIVLRKPLQKIFCKRPAYLHAIFSSVFTWACQYVHPIRVAKVVFEFLGPSTPLHVGFVIGVTCWSECVLTNIMKSLEAFLIMLMGTSHRASSLQLRYFDFKQ